ncbi:MAG TPA: serine/threonine-protein kinase [Ktedonobacteraceae bacterium]|nr:serine/threonine-protein kinase [Ktedonobacteraceae bacterium]
MRGESGMLVLAGTRMGRYRLSRSLGKGGTAEVFLAYDEQMRRTVAVKVVDSREFDLLRRFLREVETIGSLTHEHILPVFDYGEQGEWRYLVMQYVEGGTLRERLQNGPLALAETNAILQQIASALQFAHARGIIHRDIKPSNILLRGNYVYLADFGLARSLDIASSLTKTGSILGTPEYIAPELANGEATASVDIYALGIVLYQMLTGRVPFSGNSVLAIYWKHLQEAPVPPSLLNPTLPASVDAVVLRALAKDPRQRFQTAGQLAEAFALALDSHRQSRTFVDRDAQKLALPLCRLRPRNGFTLILALALLFLLATSLSFTFLTADSPRPQPVLVREFYPASLPTGTPQKRTTPTAPPTKITHTTISPRPSPPPPAKPTPKPTPRPPDQWHRHRRWKNEVS